MRGKPLRQLICDELASLWVVSTGRTRHTAEEMELNQVCDESVKSQNLPGTHDILTMHCGLPQPLAWCSLCLTGGKQHHG